MLETTVVGCLLLVDGDVIKALTYAGAIVTNSAAKNEQQRVALCRLLLERPRKVLEEEARTSKEFSDCSAHSLITWLTFDILTNLSGPIG